MEPVPYLEKNVRTHLRLLLQGFLTLWGFYFLFFLCIGLLAKSYPQLLSDDLRQQDLLDMLIERPLQLVVMAVIIAPIFEEVLFRAVVRPSREDVLLFCSGIGSFSVLSLMADSVPWYWRLLFGIAIFTGSYYLLQEFLPKRFLRKIQEFLAQHAILVIVASALLFGLVHVYNYVESFVLTSALLVAVFPRMVLGAIAGWLKLRTGALLWPILLHFINNAIVLSVLLYNFQPA